MKRILGAVALGAGVGLAALVGPMGSAKAACGKVTIAEMNWPSAALLAHVDRFILEHGYGCDAELVPGDTVPTGTSMTEKGEPDIAPELWETTWAEPLEQAIKEGRLARAGKSLSDGGEEGFWVPKYMVEKEPSLATIEGIKKNAKLFPHPEDSSKSAFMGCPAGWGCQLSSANLFRALKLADSGFELVDPGSAAGLDGAIAKAYERKEAWFGYYWAPTAILGKYEMVKVDFGTGVKEDHFLNCIAKAECAEPQVTMYPSSPVTTITTGAFQKTSPEAFAYLGKRAFDNASMNKLLAWGEENQADGAAAMANFMKTSPDTWKAWLTPDVAAKVAKAVAEL
ncbi:MAG: ABC transporter substrate-binding protein [Rhodospirillales bacterium]